MKTRRVLCALMLTLAGTAAAQSRWVIVNGQRLSDAQVMQLARMQCSEIPDGRYWLDPRSGRWGYAGNPTPQGTLGDGCQEVQEPGPRANGKIGPFPTLRRAEEEAGRHRARGHRAVAFHDGLGYWVTVSP